MLLNLCISLYTSRVVLEVLGVVDFGIYNVIGGIVLFFSFLNGTLSGSISRFFTFELGKNNLENLKKVFNTSLTIQIVLGIIIFFIAELLGAYLIKNKLVIPKYRIETSLLAFHFILFNFLFAFIRISYDASIVAYEKMSFFAYFSIFESVLKLVLTYLLLYIGYDKLVLYSVMLCIISFFGLLGNYLFCRKSFSECRYSFTYDKRFLKEILTFSFLDIYGSVCYMIGNQGVGFVLNFLWGPLLNAANGVAIQVRNAVSGFSNNIVMAARPQIVMSFSRDEIIKMINLVHLTCKYSFILLFIFTFPIIIECDFVLNLWLKDVPKYSTEFTKISLAYILIASIFYPIIIAIQSTGKMKHISIISGSLNLLTIPLMYLISAFTNIPYYSYCAIIITLLFVSGSDLIILQKYIKLFSIKSFFKKVILPCVILCISSSIIPLFIIENFDEGIKRFLFNTIFIVIEICFISYFFIIEREIKDLIFQKI
ncbi:MAG: hypothetical protein DI622_17030, partial [Chryseobacterium sp.]